MRETSLLVVAILLATPTFAQDECASAATLPAGTPTAFDTTASTPSLPAWSCADGGAADIWYTFTTTQAANVEVSTCNNSNYDDAIEIFAGDCNALVLLACNDAGPGCAAFSSIATAASLAPGTNLFIRIGGFGGEVGTGIVTLTENPDQCAVIPADALEDNDDCASAVTLLPGTTTGLNVSLTDGDFYSITVPAGESLFADATFSVAAGGDIDMYLWDPLVACDSNIEGEGAATALATGFSLTDNESISYANLTATPVTLILELDIWSGSAIFCNNYDLAIAVAVDPCFTPDALEDNDDCSNAVSISNGQITGLNVNVQDGDFYAVTVPTSGVLTVDAFFSAADAEIDLYLWDPLVTCDSNIEGEGATTGLALGFEVGDNEAIVYTNNTGSAQNVIIEVDVWTDSDGLCADYELAITGAGNAIPGPLGTNYCVQNANSSGQIGSMSSFGLTSVADNDFTLTASNLPNSQFGIFVVSAQQGFVPNAGGTSNGNICVGGLVGRYDQTGQILSTGMTGSISLPINLATIPQGAIPVATNAGDTWNFQAWFRDNVGLDSNFTDGLEVMFTL